MKQGIVYGSPFKIDWTSKEAVIAYADKLAAVGPAMSVIQVPGRPNYNITFTERETAQVCEVIYRTGSHDHG